MLDKKSKVRFKTIFEAKRAEVFILRLSCMVDYLVFKPDNFTLLDNLILGTDIAFLSLKRTRQFVAI